MFKKMKIIVTVSLSLIICLGFIIESYATEQIDIYINDKWLTRDSIIVDNRIYVPVRPVFEALGAEVTWVEDKIQLETWQTRRLVKIDTPIKLIASIPGKNTDLYAFNKDERGSAFKGLILAIDGVYKLFDWESSARIERRPELYYKDLTGDKKKELAIQLYNAYEKGNVVHIINPENFLEYEIEDPLDIIADNIEVKVISEKEAEVIINDAVAASINLDNIPQEHSALYPDTISKIYYAQIYYGVGGNILAADARVAANFFQFIGSILIEYSFQDGEFKAEKISFHHIGERW